MENVPASNTNLTSNISLTSKKYLSISAGLYQLTAKHSSAKQTEINNPSKTNNLKKQNSKQKDITS